MTAISPFYNQENVRVAFQLNWSLAIFSRTCIPDATQWLDLLRAATERDRVRILEYHLGINNTHQFLLSTEPAVVPAAIVKSVKGRLQNAIHLECPDVFRRSYRLTSVGETNGPTLQDYVGRQAQHHRMADARVQQRLESLQFHDPAVDLAELQYSAHGQYLVNLHLVFENRDRLQDIREESLRKTRDMVIGVARKNDYRLARIGLTGNHFHILLGCRVTDDAISLGLAFMNNTAYAHQMKPVLEYSFYAGTFGPYDRDAIRRCL